jgi:hypothetical protein
MEPVLDGSGAYEIELRRHVGEPDGGEPSIDLHLVFRVDCVANGWSHSPLSNTPRSRLSGTSRNR